MTMASEAPLEQSLGFKVFLAVPVPGLDVAAGLAVYAVESAVRDGVSDASRVVSDSIASSLDEAGRSLLAAASAQTADLLGRIPALGSQLQGARNDTLPPDHGAS